MWFANTKPIENNIGERLAVHGWAAVSGLVDADFRALLCQDLEFADDICSTVRSRNGLTANVDGSLHHILGLRPSFMEFLERRYLHREIEKFFSGKYILNSFGGVINRRGIQSYLHRIHRDVRTFLPDARLLINMLVALDDFTEANGATYVLSGSHLRPERPPDDTFFNNAERLIVEAGTIVLFDSNLWHSAGKNIVRKPRRALTLNFSRPFVKQQLDYPAYLGTSHGCSLSEPMRQILGYNSLTPKSLDEWYQPPERRSYRPDQE